MTPGGASRLASAPPLNPSEAAASDSAEVKLPIWFLITQPEAHDVIRFSQCLVIAKHSSLSLLKTTINLMYHECECEWSDLDIVYFDDSDWPAPLPHEPPELQDVVKLILVDEGADDLSLGRCAERDGGRFCYCAGANRQTLKRAFAAAHVTMLSAMCSDEGDSPLASGITIMSVSVHAELERIAAETPAPPPPDRRAGVWACADRDAQRAAAARDVVAAPDAARSSSDAPPSIDADGTVRAGAVVLSPSHLTPDYTCECPQCGTAVHESSVTCGSCSASLDIASNIGVPPGLSDAPWRRRTARVVLRPAR